MKTIFTIARRELKAYFVSPIAYVYLVTFLSLVVGLFLRNFFIVGEANLRPFFDLVPWVYLFFIPAVAMGKWAEEKKTGTIEFLFTLPIEERDILLGKFFAGLGLITLALLFTFPLLLVVAGLGRADWGPIVGGYLGLLMMGGAYLAIGLWLSSLTENQIIAFILGVAVCFVLFIIGQPIVTTGFPPWLVSLLQTLSLGNHFESIGRGVIDSRDLIYYLSVIAFFLFLNLKRPPRVFIATLFIALTTLNLLTANHVARLDLTRQKVFTLSKPTKEVLKNLDDLITLRLYFSKDLPPALASLQTDVKDFLSELKNYGGRQIQIEYHDPQENPVEEQKVQMMGIPPVEVNVIKQDKQELAKVYLGMTISHEAKQEVIPVIQTAKNLEYELVSAVIKITQKEKPKLGWWSEEEEEKENFGLITDYLKRRFELQTINEKNLAVLNPKEVPAFLFVVPPTLSKEAIAAFQNYLDQGGKAILLIDRYAIKMGQGIKPEPKENRLEALLKSYGISVQNDLVLDPSSAMATFTGGVITYQLPYPFWIQIRPEGFSADLSFVSNLNSLVLPWASSLKIDLAAKDARPLFQTTPKAVSVENIASFPTLDPASAKSALAMGKEGTYFLGTFVGQKLIVVGNSRFIQDNFLERFQENLLFLENAVDILTTGGQLIPIRSKAMTTQPIAMISDSAREGIKGLVMAIGPLLLGGIGLAIFLKRKRRAKRLRGVFAEC